jgi:hypothetical protein
MTRRANLQQRSVVLSITTHSRLWRELPLVKDDNSVAVGKAVWARLKSSPETGGMTRAEVIMLWSWLYWFLCWCFGAWFYANVDLASDEGIHWFSLGYMWPTYPYITAVECFLYKVAQAWNDFAWMMLLWWFSSSKKDVVRYQENHVTLAWAEKQKKCEAGPAL